MKRNHSQIAKKAWRTRKLMKKTRPIHDRVYAQEYELMALRAKRRTYMQHVLPCPDYGKK